MKKETRGGPGRGQGRKPVGDTPAKKYNVTLDEATADALRAYGGGNLSEGVRRAARSLNLLSVPVALTVTVG